MKSQKYQNSVVQVVCVALALVASVSSAPNWPTPEFFERHYHNVAPPASNLALRPRPNTNLENANAESAASSPVALTKGDTRALKPRWSNRRRLSAHEAVAVMEEELQRREAAKAINTPIKDDIKEEPQPAASNTDLVAAPANRRSGHHMGVTGPVHTFVKTDKHGHYKWGVRHHAGHGFS